MGKWILSAVITLVFTVILLDAKCAHAEIDGNYSCVDTSWNIDSKLEDLWAVARKSLIPVCRNTVYSAHDYAGVFYQLHARLPFKTSRTFGPYLELEDRVRWMKQQIDAHRIVCAELVQGSAVVYWLVFNDLARCYGR